MAYLAVIYFTITLPVFIVLDQSDAVHITISPIGSANCTDSDTKDEDCTVPLPALYANNNDTGALQLTENTTITFLSGVHTLKSHIIFRDIDNLTLVFLNESKFHCENRRNVAFINITNLCIVGLKMTNCGAEVSRDIIDEALYVQTESVLKIKSGLKAAIFAVNIRKLHMGSTTINGSHGYGFLGINVVGHSLITNTMINSSNTNSLNDHDCRSPAVQRQPSRAAKCHGGNALFLYNDYRKCPDMRESYSLTVDNSTFSHSLDLTDNFNHYVSQGYGLGVVAIQIYYDIHVVLVNSTFSNNEAKSFGSNLFIRLIFSETKSDVTIRNCHIMYGRCSYCRVPRGIPYSTFVFLYGLRVPSSRSRYKQCPNVDQISQNRCIAESEERTPPTRRQVLLVENSTFYANRGGTIYIILFSNLIHTHTYTVFIRNCTLRRNEAAKSGALYIADIGPRPENTKELEMVVEDTTFDEHTLFTKPQLETDVERQPNTNLLLSIKNFTFRGCIFTKNDATALLAHDTTLYFEGTNIFEGNKAITGGAIQLTGVSIIYLRPNTQITFDNNSAVDRGGAVYMTKGSEESYLFDCQIQVFDPTFVDLSQLNITLTFVNNTAQEAGDALYGGRIDACYTAAPSMFLYSRTYTRSTTFDAIADIYGQPPSNSIISSDAVRICFCFSNNHNCSVMKQMLYKFPGEEFQVSVVGVGYREGTVPTVVLAYSTTNKFQNSSQQTGRFCTDTFYRVKSNLSTNVENLFLKPNTATRLNAYRPLQMSINLLDCHTLTGFVHNSEKKVCTCEPKLQKINITCDITTRMITRQPPYWLGNYSNHLLLHDNCPYDYCKTTPVQIVMREPNISQQCAYNRYGTLCGSCKEGYSQVLGSSKCLKCSNTSLLLIIPFALAGIVLVTFLFTLNLTVSIGTINGLIFYANILKINETVFFPPGDNSFLYVFISWLNLDLGIETCLYDGMTSLVKVSLQFVFPFYLWALITAIILAFRHSIRLVKIARIFGNHSVSVLATIFLLSCTKIQRTITSALSLTTLHYPGGKRVLWLYDGNIQYAKSGHLALLLFSLSFLLVIGLPYALLIFGVQYLRRYSNRWCLRWVNRLMPIFDAYLGPYKPKKGYWTGLLIFIRVLLVVVFAVNVFGNPAIDIFVVSVVALLLVTFNLGQGGVYKRNALTLLQISYIVNLGLLAAATALVRQIDGKQRPAIIYTSTAIALATFVGTLVYHVKIQSAKWYVQFKRYKQRKKRHILSQGSGDYGDSLDETIISHDNMDTSWKLVTTTVIDGFNRDTEN